MGSRSNNFLIIALLSALSLWLLSGVGVNLRSVVAVLFSAIFILSYRIKSLVTSSIIITIFSLQFFYPNKYYLIEVIKSYEISGLTNFEGYLQGYGLNIPNVLTIATIIIIIYELIRKRQVIDFTKIHRILPIAISITLCLVYLLLSGLYLSPLPALSLIWSVQYMQVYIIAFIILYVYLFNLRHFHYLYLSVVASILLQLVICLNQFRLQSLIGLAIERPAVQSIFGQPGLDANILAYRVSGSFMYHNELGLIALILAVILLPGIIKKENIIYTIGIISVLIIEILTQSRSAWIASFLVSIIYIRQYKRFVFSWIRSIKISKALIFAIIIISGLSYIIFPRFTATFNSNFEGAGLSLRNKMIIEGFNAFTQNPFTGYGVGTNEFTLFKLYPNGVITEFPAPVHFGIIQMLLEIGLIGSALFIFPFLFLIRKYFVKDRRIISGLSDNDFVFLAGCLVFFVDYLFLAYIGIIEFAYLGIIFGFGLTRLYSQNKKLKQCC